MRSQHLEFVSLDECRIQVGKDAKSNDQLSLCTSRPDEWWMHWEGGAGAHVIICCRDDSIQTNFPETLKDAATLALHHSKAVPIDKKTYTVTLTRPRYLQKPKGSKDGMVQIVCPELSLIRHSSKKRKLKQIRKAQSGEMPVLETVVERFSIRYEGARYERLMESQRLLINNK